MANIVVTETFEDREHNAKALAERGYKRKFWAVTDDHKIGPAEVRFAAGVPRLGDPYYTPFLGVDSGTYAVDIRVKQRNESPFFWVVEVDYSSKFDSAGSAGGNQG